jgi:hypothetical protein
LHLPGAAALNIRRLEGFGLGMMECTRLREKEDSDLDQIRITVCGDKGMKGCTTMFPKPLKGKLSDPARKSR